MLGTDFNHRGHRGAQGSLQLSLCALCPLWLRFLPVVPGKLYARQRWMGFPALHRLAPLCQGTQKRSQLNPFRVLRMTRQVPHGALHHRAHADNIPSRVMVKGHRHLHQPLQELLFSSGRGAPDVFQNLVGLEELSAIEQRNAMPVLVQIHRIILAQMRCCKKKTSRCSARLLKDARITAPESRSANWPP